MAGTFINVETEGAEEFRAALDLIRNRGQNLAPVFADIGDYLRQAHDDRFKKQESPEGEPWKELSTAYLLHKKENKDRILVLRDHLAHWLNYEATAESLLFGSNLPYAATHQFGRGETTRKKTGTVYDAKIPARPFLGLSNDDLNEVKRLLGDWLLGE